ncbi:MAG: DinB family protein [Lewinella sp.]|uniref:DinB family protein n=1 Tax=Lewinella sp. TaxID=2004506 RepID=UPI003D6AB7D2
MTIQQAIPIIQELTTNQLVFTGLLQDANPKMILWRPQPEHWCLLEVVCHLYDEEREDFRQRIKLLLEDPTQPLPPFDPTKWVQERAYLAQDYTAKTAAFLKERTASITWLQSLTSPAWDNTYQHPKLGPMSAGLFLANWLAHDQLHIRQINRIKRAYLQQTTDIDLSYAGNW